MFGCADKHSASSAVTWRASRVHEKRTVIDAPCVSHCLKYINPVYEQPTPSPSQCNGSESENDKSGSGTSPSGLPPNHPSHVFDETTGRLCLLNASTKHKVTLGEIQRRLAPPETLHASLINGILRKAKTRDSCAKLRERLAEKGFSLPNGRRKTAPTTLFTALCEREALLLAEDFDSICQSTLNTFEIARHVNRNIYTLFEMNAASRVLMGILEAFEEVPQDPADYVDDRIPANYSVNMLSLLTHGFGHNAIKTALKMAVQIVDQQRAIIHGVRDSFPKTPPPYVPYSQSPAPRFT
ncbi:hypothetical protein Y032_0061g3274 [Ancylostoma ceylanicum]|uniref:Transcription factor AP-2 C-terminal domain-containing protein n=1 Tax=Ancylostoma ceylanicum TaxID=53326 RepID=A0A016U354_9BILA|nr:hypothetical protein Y032_0061g3274 [Ancylostoma ceylanicum]